MTKYKVAKSEMKEVEKMKPVKRRYYTAEEVAEMMGVCTSTGYRVIRKLNEELQSQGYLTVAGKVDQAYFDSKMYGGAR